MLEIQRTMEQTHDSPKVSGYFLNMVTFSFWVLIYLVWIRLCIAFEPEISNVELVVIRSFLWARFG